MIKCKNYTRYVHNFLNVLVNICVHSFKLSELKYLIFIVVVDGLIDSISSNDLLRIIKQTLNLNVIYKMSDIRCVPTGTKPLRIISYNS